MALREKNRHVQITASGGGTLTAPSYEGFRVKDIMCVPSSSDTYLTLIIDGVTVQKIRVKGKAGNHAAYRCVYTAAANELTPRVVAPPFGLMSLLGPIALAAGQILTVTRYAEAGNVTLVYDAFDADDVKADEPNGQKAAVRRYLHYLTNAAAITASPSNLDSSLIWAGGESWPIAARQVPANTTIKLLGILAAPVAKGNASANIGYTTHLNLLVEGDYLLSDTQSGVPLLGDVAQTAAAASYKPIGSAVGPLTAEYPYPALLFDEPLVFGPGETLTPQIVAAGLSGAGIAAAEVDVALILERTVGA